MELIERAGFLATLKERIEYVTVREGHCILISGEAGIGKTSLVRSFYRENISGTKMYQGTCDALFTPRPLAPLYDIALQMKDDFWLNNGDTSDRAGLFARFFHELHSQNETTLIVIEDIHWADEATLDFIKFLARRIIHLRCLFILTYRDEAIHSRHPLRNVLGQLNPGSFTRLRLLPLSRQAVEKMAREKGYCGEDVYSISGGNPFYVNEILASYSPGIPDNIKDSILAVYNRQDGKAKHVWEILSVHPAGIEIKYLEKMEPGYAAAIETCLDAGILILNKGLIFFKHELYRRTIENSLSPLLRIVLNKRILDLLLESFEQNGEIERIVHHAKNANEYELVVKYAPVAAGQAASAGAHIEASKLYLSAMEYYQGNDKNRLVQFYELYAYECYLTNQINEAIISQEKALKIRKEGNDIEKTGNCIRFLSRLWWFDGNREKAENYGRKAIEILENQPPSKTKAMALSNMSQLKMLADQRDDCVSWGEKAIAMAKQLNDEETLSHALNNVGDVLMRTRSSGEKGIELLQQSLRIALKNSYHEHVARAYTNLGSSALVMKDYVFAKETLEAGIQYCEEYGLESWTAYMLSCKAKLNLETGLWDEACRIADNCIKNEDQAPIVRIGALVVAGTIKMRRGDSDTRPLLLEAKAIAFETMELQRIIPVLVALLQYEWLTGKDCIEKESLDRAISMVEQMGNVYENSEFAFWLLKARKQHLPLREFYEGYQTGSQDMALKAAALWEQLGCPFEQALTLFEGSDIDKRKAITIIHQLGANAIYEKMKQEMRTSGIKNIPRGIRKTTRSNPAFLTERELAVLELLKEGIQNKEIASKLFISPKTVDHHISAILFKLDVNSRAKAVQIAVHREIIK